MIDCQQLLVLLQVNKQHKKNGKPNSKNICL